MIDEITKFYNSYPSFIYEIIDAIGKAGYEAYLVGGCVRDMLLSRTPGDYDIASSASPFDIMRIFNKTVPTGIKYGTVTVFIGENCAEVTTYRSEIGYADYRRPAQVEFVNNIKEDLARRDFTVNAMAFSPKRGLYDPFGGKEDLEKRIIRCVGEPQKRFDEDALRILRAFRFAAQLDFTIDSETLTAAREKAPNVQRISGERIYIETDKILQSNNPDKIFDAIDCGCLIFLRREKTALKKISLTGFPDNQAVKWAALFYIKALDMELTLTKLHFSNQLKNEIKAYLKYLVLPFDDKKEAIKSILSYGLSTQEVKNLLFLYNALLGIEITKAEQRLREIIDNKEPYNLKMLAVKGQDLIDIGLPKGPQCGQILKILLESVIENPTLNDRITLIEVAKKLSFGH